MLGSSLPPNLDRPMSLSENRDSPLAGRRVLVAEDQATNRWLMRCQLEALGLAAELAEDGPAALAALGAARFDVLITDCHMPGMDGTTLAQHIRDAETRGARQHLAIMGLTADITAATRDRCYEAGMDAVELKPLSLPRLKAALCRLLGEEPSEIGPAAQGPDVEPLFDPTTYRELFEPGDPEGQKWLAGYLHSVANLVAEISASAAAADNKALAAHAHRLAGASFSVGLLRLGAFCRALEGAAERGDRTAMHTLTSEVPTAHRIASEEIARFVAARGGRETAS
jgi:CheY-like chemotaxis protein/HPt (histidine-containing phosphotransfer) domain-containing protein